MKTFLTDFKRSLSDWKFYKEIVTGQHPLRLWYAAILAVISSVVVTIVFTVLLYTVLLPKGKEYIIAHFPADLVATVKGGELSVNQPMPYKIVIPKENEKQDKKNKDAHTNFLVIDTNAEATLDAPSKYDTYVFANKTNIVAEKSKNEVRAYPLKEFPDFTLSSETIKNFFDSAAKYAWIVPIGLFFLATFGAFIGLLFTYLLAALLLMLIMKIASRSITFANAFKASMYAYTFIFLLNIVLTVLAQGSFGLISSVLLTDIIVCLFLFIPPTVVEAPKVPDIQ